MNRAHELNKQAQAKLEEVTQIFDKLGDEQPDAETKSKVIDLNKAAEDLLLEAQSVQETESIKQQSSERLAKLKETERQFRLEGEPEKKALSMAEQVAQLKTIGQTWLENKEIKAWMDSVAPGGRVPADSANIKSPSAPVESKALITGLSSTSAGAFVVNDRLNIVDEGTFYRPLAIRDIITIGQTGSDTVEYVRQGAHTNAAAAVAEATATAGASGTKPESAMVLAVVTELVKTIAHWIPATRRALSDAGQMRTLIDSFLRYGLQEELEDQMLTGNGVGENFTGVRNVSGITTQAFDTDALVTTRKARTKVRTTGRAIPNAFVMHPNDWQNIDLLKDNESRYYFGGPREVMTPRLWGLPVVEAEAMTEGFTIVANWKLAVLWDREQADIMVDTINDQFIRNLLTILAELRAAFGVIRPAAFVEADIVA